MPRAAPSKARTYQYRAWRGVNLTDARPAIDDDELAWMENAVTIGKGAIQVLPAQGASIATIAAGIATMTGFVLNSTAIVMTVNSDGSVSQITIPGGVVTAVAAAGTLTTSARMTNWRGTTILVIDPTNGYFSWDGTTWTVIDATRLGIAIAVFEGRAWIGRNRTITFSAPNTFSNFAAGDGAGSTILTDAAFDGNIVAMVSALEELWILGSGAIEAIANVAATGTSPNVVTTFSVTNIVANVGTNAAASVIGYFRALAFFAPFGAYALSGVTPQKLSEKLDGLSPDITLSGNIPAAVAVVQNLLCLLFLVTYTGNNAQDQVVNGAGNITMLLGFTQGKWFFAVQNRALRWMTTVLVGGVAQAWGTSGTNIYRLFGAAATAGVTYKVQFKFYDFGLSTTVKALLAVGLEVQATNPIAPTLLAESEITGQNLSVSFQNQITLIGAGGATITLIGAGGAAITLISQGMVLTRQDAALAGRYLSATLSGTDPPYRIQALQFLVVPDEEWAAVVA